jgi:hypothetical protein
MGKNWSGIGGRGGMEMVGEERMREKVKRVSGGEKGMGMRGGFGGGKR